MRQIAKPKGFKSVEYVSLSPRVWNSTNSCWAILTLLKEVFYIRINPLDVEEYMLSQKLLVDVGIDTFAGENQPSAA